MLTTLELAGHLRVTVGRLARRLRQQSLGGLTPSQASVLATLDRLGPMSLSKLAECEAISRPSTTGIVSRLVDKGLVEKSPDPDDGRSAIVAATTEGADLLDTRRRERTAYLNNQIDALTAEERTILEAAVEILDRMNQSK